MLVNKKLKFETLVEKLNKNINSLIKNHKVIRNKFRLVILEIILLFAGILGVSTIFFASIMSFINIGYVRFDIYNIMLSFTFVLMLYSAGYFFLHKPNVIVEEIDENDDIEQLKQRLKKYENSNSMIDKLLYKMISLQIEVKSNLIENTELIFTTTTITYQMFWVALCHIINKEYDHDEELILKQLPEAFVQLFHEAKEELFNFQNDIIPKTEEDLKILGDYIDKDINIPATLSVLCKSKFITREELCKAIELPEEVLKMLFE
jgi:ABC-type antimicrobial peptide transport system permease subunit